MVVIERYQRSVVISPFWQAFSATVNRGAVAFLIKRSLNSADDGLSMLESMPEEDITVV